MNEVFGGEKPLTLERSGEQAAQVDGLTSL